MVGLNESKIQGCQMNEQEKWEYINKLDEELLVGGVILSEWSTFLIREAETAFCNGASLAAILIAVAGIESHLRFEYFSEPSERKQRLHDLIENAPIPHELKQDLHKLRRYRNKWVHVEDPSDDEELLNRPEYVEKEIENTAQIAIRVLMQTIYLEQWI